MKKIYLLIITGLMFGTALYSQNIKGIDIKNIYVETDSVNVNVSFDAHIKPKAARRGITVIYAPVISGNNYRVSLPPVVVQGKRAAKDWMRHEWAAGQQSRFENAIYAQIGEEIKYSAEVGFQDWMHGSRIEVETITAGCCSSQGCLTILQSDLLPVPVPEVISIPEPENDIEIPEATIGEVLAETFPFVLPASEFDPEHPIVFYDDERDNALTVYYRINLYDIEENYSDNRQTLINLLAAIDLIQSGADSNIERVVVAGFASPEGPFEVNDRLAWERAVSVKKYIMDNSDMPDESVILFNGSADWRGLRFMVAMDQNVPARQQVLELIDNHPIWNARTQTGRLTLLRNLDRGSSYRYLAEHIFPKLRNGAFIRVYYNDAQTR